MPNVVIAIPNNQTGNNIVETTISPGVEPAPLV